MKKTLFSAALVVAFGMAAAQASANDGTITFNGTITDVSCKVSGGGAASGSGNSIQVTLPTVSTTALSADGQTAGDTSFSLVLTCDGTSAKDKTGAMWVETSQTPALDSTTGALKNEAGGTATNVQVRMVNPANNKPINLAVNGAVTNGATVIAANNQPAATITNNSATLNYIGQYLAKGGAATAGTVSTHLVFSMQYN